MSSSDDDSDDNAQHNENSLILYNAAHDGELDKCIEAIKNGASPDYQKHNGYTPLHISAQEGHVEIVKYLIVKCSSGLCYPVYVLLFMFVLLLYIIEIIYILLVFSLVFYPVMIATFIPASHSIILAFQHSGIGILIPGPSILAFQAFWHSWHSRHWHSSIPGILAFWHSSIRAFLASLNSKLLYR